MGSYAGVLGSQGEYVANPSSQALIGPAPASYPHFHEQVNLTPVNQQNPALLPHLLGSDFYPLVPYACHASLCSLSLCIIATDVTYFHGATGYFAICCSPSC